MGSRVLLVDDNPENHEKFGGLLRSSGFEVIDADDGITAINKVFSGQPDVVVLDIKIPRINGYQVCRLLKDYPITKSIPVILMTREASLSYVREPEYWSLYSGADAYIDKEDVSGLLDAVKKYAQESGAGHRVSPQPPLTDIEILTELSHLLDKQFYMNVRRLEDLNERKSAFVANVAHEIRSPLAIIKGYTENIYDGLLGEVTDKQRDALSTINNTVERLSRLVHDLLDVAKIETGHMKLNRERIVCQELLSDIISTYDVLIKENEISIKMEIPKEPLYMEGDKDRLTQVFINLLSNSLKFIPKGGSITFRIIDEKNTVRFDIEDNGPGIDPKSLEKIFDKFVRISVSEREGTGLGLPIARDIVKLHRGEIWAESRKGSGSEFIVVLPKYARY